LPEPQWLAGNFAVGGPAEGVYLATTRHGRRLERVTAYGLGERGGVAVGADDDGLLVVRLGNRGFRIPDRDLVAVRRSSGVTWHRWRRGGVVVISWRLGSSELDTIIAGHRGSDAIPVEAPVNAVLRRRARA